VQLVVKGRSKITWVHHQTMAPCMNLKNMVVEEGLVEDLCQTSDVPTLSKTKVEKEVWSFCCISYIAAVIACCVYV